MVHELVRLEGPGASLVVSAEPSGVRSQTSFPIRIVIVADPFEGVAEDVLEAEELALWASNLRSLAVSGFAEIGATGGVRLDLRVEPDTQDRICVVVDFESHDEQVRLRFSIFGQAPFWDEMAREIESVLNRRTRLGSITQAMRRS